VAILDRTRGARTALPLARGILELVVAAASAAGRNDDDADEDVVVAAARCAPSLAMTREREMRGFRADSIVVVPLAGGRSGL